MSCSAPAPLSADPAPDLEGPATLPAFWRQAVENWGDEALVRCEDGVLSYREVETRSAALARGLLAQGAGKGSRIGLLEPNSADWVVAWLAINRIGALAVTLSTFFAGPELAYAVRHADVAILLSADRHLRNDYVARLEAAFPELAQATPGSPLALAGCPYLRSVWFTHPVDRPWSAGTLADLQASGAASELISEPLLAAVEESVSPADLALLIYTSGSTAYPKAVLHTQGVMVRKVLALSRGNGIIPYGVARGDRTVLTMPLFWIGGFLSLAGVIWRGASVVLVDDHTPQAILEAVRRERATHLSGSEAALNALRSSEWARAGDLDGLKPQNTNQLPFFRTGLDRRRLPMSIGMTETFGPHSGLIAGGLLPPEAAGSLGPVLEGMAYKIVDPETGAELPPGEFGELCVRGAWLMEGMYKKERAEVFDADGYYHTGDQCALRADGYLFYGARLSGMIKTSGANVSPEEVEAVIRAEPDVLDAAVFGVPDAKLGQMVVAVVATVSGRPLDEEALKARLKTRLSSFKTPKRILFRAFDDLPRTPSNKIRKPALAEMVAGELA